ncbi:NADH-ubiquinone oxidoreductase subunit 6 [Devosia limi DSM 17137]|uniref:NADH-ubiquinone oxidoreductase subunit 6 n=1 Tax=Devosia limi DSM 17137 TaxID=1121477 RepID=A0A0F5LS82_9HYPH|nr:FAD-dependent oxidoreductase [Devosia limi]KKB85146.1 NADH-ubiquinone oxidoreductase subunit 6 [Devosia limi DSM 17137]SHF77538.1 Predicted NAD/FAD-binding protein [Devosia limi DSM 17137]
MTSSRIAIVGSGISGLSAAWLLSRNHDVTVFEKNAKLGGHSNTVLAKTGQGSLPVDTGFIVYNEQNYPNLTAMFDHLGVATSPSSMSFAVSVAEGRMEYSGKHLNGLFGQRRNIIRPEHWKLVSDIIRFFREAERQVATCPQDMSIADFLDQFGYSRVFIEDHILPISAAIWSTPSRGMLEFPARTFIEFFANHSLLQVGNRPQWRTVTGGSREYVNRLVGGRAFSTVTSAKIVSVIRRAEGVEILLADGQRQRFDEIIFACHADEALVLLGDPTDEERAILSAFRFSTNRAVLHTDQSFMPRRKHLWSSWNYLRGEEGESNLSLTYWMNRLQPLPTTTNVFVTLNPHRPFADGAVQYEMDYQHPLFDARAIAAQRDVWQIQGVQRSWFAGAWLGYGFHEDGLQAGLEVAERIGPRQRPWTVQRSRIAHNWVEGDRRLWAAE